MKYRLRWIATSLTRRVLRAIVMRANADAALYLAHAGIDVDGLRGVD